MSSASPRPPISHSTPRSWIERTLVSLNDTLEQSFFAERIARQKGLLQALDPRMKILITLLLLIAASATQRLSILVGLYLLALLLALTSSVPMKFFIRRIWVLIPLFTGVIALPALFLTPGPAWVHLSPGITITQTGLKSALFLLLRVGNSVSLAVLLVLTTPWNQILKALGVLHLPDVILLILEMTYRYIHLLLHSAQDMFLSRKSRLIRRPRPAEERRQLAAHIATLLNQSLEISEEVYLSMQARGYRGYPRTLQRLRLRFIDWACGTAALAISIAAIWLGR